MSAGAERAGEPVHGLTSFVIPHKGRETLLRETVASLAAQETSHPWELLLMTQNPELAPETRALLATLPATVDHAPSDLTIAALRNRGAALARGEWLAFLDADVGLAPDWLETMQALLKEHPGRRLVSAQQRCAENATPLEQVRTQLSNMTVDAPVTFLPGRNLFLHRGSFEAVGGFPEHLVTCEDYWFTERVASLGELWYTSTTSYEHLGEDRDYGEMFRKELWRGQSNLQSIRGRRVALAEWPSFVVPPLVTGLLTLALLLALAGRVGLALGSLLAPLLLTGFYVLRLFRAGHGRLGIAPILKFYLYYFPARALGTLAGLFRPLRTDSHNS